MKKINRYLRYLEKRLGAFSVAVYISLLMSQRAYAADINNSPIVKGTEKLLSDVTTWLMILAPVVAGLLIIYFCIRRSAADEMDQSAATRCC